MPAIEELPAVTPGRAAGLHPLSHQQEGLIAMMARIQERHGYWMSYSVRLTGPVDAGRLHDAITIVAARHPALRTTFSLTSSALLQNVGPDPPEVELADTEAGLASLVQRARSGDVLTGASPCRIGIRPHAEGCDVGLAVHHLIFDDWSWGLFLAELGAAYRYLDCEPLPDPPAVAYSDYARWQHRYVIGDRYHRHLAYWRHRVDGFPPTGMAFPHMATDRPAAGPADTISFPVDPQLRRQLDHLANTAGATLFVALTALFHGALAAFCASDDVLTGVVTANRRRPELRDVIGFFANGRFLRTRVDPMETVGDFIRGVGRQWSAGHAHQELHLEKTVVDLGLPALVNVKFALQNALDYLPAPSFGDSITAQLPPGPPARSSRRDLYVWLEPTTDGLDGHVTYRTDALTRQDAQRLTLAYVEALRRSTANPATLLSTVFKEP